MTSSLAIISFIITVLIAEGCALQCLTCSGDSPSNCTGSVENCTHWQDACIAKYYTLTKSGSESSVYTLGCGMSSHCNFTYSMTVPTMREELNSTCCMADNCVPDIPAVPSTTAEPNGLMCYSCLSEKSGSCPDPGTMECSGMEDKCLQFVITVTTGLVGYKAAFSGCASESYCRNSPVLKSLGLTVKIDINCTSGDTSPTSRPSTTLEDSTDDSIGTDIASTDNTTDNSGVTSNPNMHHSTGFTTGTSFMRDNKTSTSSNITSSTNPSMNISTSSSPSTSHMITSTLTNSMSSGSTQENSTAKSGTNGINQGHHLLLLALTVLFLLKLFT
ncbi:phospholipase A2 inhibitor and Ly6/PLAUR domain-containing protein-like [Lissotriton helveticus]